MRPWRDPGKGAREATRRHGAGSPSRGRCAPRLRK
jgi:hypothetical protein